MLVNEDRRTQLIDELRGFWLTEFDEELSAFRAERLLDYLLDAVGPAIYNQAVHDARAWMLKKLEDLEGDVYAAE